jgi:zinc protease
MRTHIVKRTPVLALAALGACASPKAASAPQPASAPAPTVARQAPPAPLPLRPLEFPGFRETTLPNGLRLIVVEHHAQPVANVNLYVQGGSASDPAAKLGLADLTATLLTKGTPTRTAKQIAERIEGVGGNLSAFAQRDYVGISSGVLAENLPLAFQLLGDVALNPTFPASELETARTRTLSALQASLTQPASIAQRRFAREVYGDAHPYGRAPLPQTVKAITRADLVNFHRANFRANNALLVVSGDVSADSVIALARKTFGSWKGGTATPLAFTTPPARGATQITLVNRPGSAQSNILIGDVAVRPDNPDYPALQVLNKIVGGGTDARLFLILREQKGWTYGAYSNITRPKDVGYYVASAEVRTAVTDSALAEMLHQLNRVRDEPVSTAELDAAKSYLTGSFPLTIETAGQIAGQVAQTRLLGLPIEDLTRYREHIAAVTAADVQRVAQKYIRPDHAAIVVVGDAKAVLPGLEKIAPVELYDVEGKVIQRADLDPKPSTDRFDTSRLKPRTLTYDVIVQGSPMGTATSTLSREGDVWVSKTTMNFGPLDQQGELRFRSDFTGISSTQVSAQGAVDVRLSSGKVTGTATLPPALGGDKTFDAEVPAGTLLPGMDEYAIAMTDLATGKSITLPLFNVGTGSVTPLTLRVTGAEQVTVPAGTFPAFRLEASGGPASVVMFVRQDLPHTVLRQEFVGQPLSIELKSVQ